MAILKSPPRPPKNVALQLRVDEQQELGRTGSFDDGEYQQVRYACGVSRQSKGMKKNLQ